MRLLTICLFIVCCFLNFNKIADAQQIVRWVLAEHGEFNGDRIDEKTWDIKHLKRCDNGTKEHTRPNNVEVDNGLLKIKAKKESYNGCNYTSGRIESLQKFKYGQFEMRFRLMNGDSLNFAFWMVQNTNYYSEIDIFEICGYHSNEFCFNTHCLDGCPNPDDHNNTQMCFKKSNGSFKNEFNTIKLEWGPEAMFVYLNDQQIGGKLINMKKAMKVIASIAVGGPCGGAPNQSNLPASLEIDYIRIWKRIDCNETVDTCNYKQTSTHERVITGKNIEMGGNNCEALIQNNEYADMKATNEVTLKPGFHAKHGSNVHGQIVPCPGPSTQKRSSNNTKITSEPSLDQNNQIDSTDSPVEEANPSSVFINLYPNPNNGILNVEITGEEDSQLDIKIMNLSGKVIFENNDIQRRKFRIDLSDKPTGVYIFKTRIGDKILTRKISFQ